MMAQETKRESNNRKFRSLLHLAMGGIYLLLGFFVLYYRSFGSFKFEQTFMAYALGGLIVAYGLFRLWRGISSLKRRPEYRNSDLNT